MNKPVKSFEETLAEQMQNPEFREGFCERKRNSKSLLV